MIRLLLVDDHEIVRRGLRELLEANSDLTVTHQAGTLEAALALDCSDVDVAVLDVLMPGISGDAVAHRLRQLDPDLPVLLMTGADNPFVAASGAPILRKPFPHEELVAAVRRLVK